MLSRSFQRGTITEYRTNRRSSDMHTLPDGFINWCVESKPSPGITQPFREVTSVLPGMVYSSSSLSSRPEKALAAAARYSSGFSGFSQAKSNALLQALLPLFLAYWFKDAVVWHARFSVPYIRQQLLHFMFQISGER